MPRLATPVRHTPPPAAPPSSHRPFWATAGALFVMILGANLAAPLYAVYARRFGFSDTVLTLVFATYAVVLVPALLVLGQLSDTIGRRRMMVVGLAAAMLGLGLFAAASGLAWLFAARAVQGIAVGATTGTATAALVELERSGDRRRAAAFATLAQAGGTSVAPLLAGILAQWAPRPLVLAYLAGLVVTAAAMVAILRLPERGGDPGRGWRIQRPGVPRDARARFARDSLTAAAVWAVAALYVSVVPSYAAALLHTHNLALLGAISGLMLASSCGVLVVAMHRMPVRAPQPVGLLLLTLGLVALAVAFPAHSLAILILAAVLAGAGHGLGFLGAQEDLNHLAPEERRGAVTAAFITTVYAGVASSVIGVGVVSDLISLDVAVALFAIVIGAVALATAAWHALAAGRAA
jgi:MFS family permease